MTVRKINVSSMENKLIDKMNPNLKKQTSTDKEYADAYTNNKMNDALKAIEKETPYEWVANPKHYNNYDVEVIDMIEKIWGTYLASIWCQITAFKYRMRMGTKPDNDFSQDLKKELWYLNKYHELTQKLNK